MPRLPEPVWNVTPPITWGMHAADAPLVAPGSAPVGVLIGWGDAAPAPIGLEPMERIAISWYGAQLDFGPYVENMNNIWKRSDGLWEGGKLPTPMRAVCWGTDPSLVLPWTYTDTNGHKEIGTVTWNSLPPKVYVPGQDGVDNVVNIYGQGTAALPAMRLTQVEINSLLQHGDDKGWIAVGGNTGTYVLDMFDLRFAKINDGTWMNRNYPKPIDNLGMAIGIAHKPEHGIAGFLNAVWTDVKADPLGAILFLIVFVAAGPALALALYPLATAAVVAAVVTRPQAVVNDVIKVAEHPAEIGDTVAGAELIAVGDILGIKPLSKIGGKLLGKGAVDWQQQNAAKAQQKEAVSGPTGADFVAAASGPGGGLGGSGRPASGRGAGPAPGPASAPPPKPQKWWEIFRT